jgi:hypothetical protein
MFDVDIPITDWKLTLKGFLSGSILASSVIMTFKGYDLFLYLFLFVLGFCMFIDSIIPYGRNPSIGSSVVAALIGAVISIGFYYINYIELYAVISVILSLFVYIYTFLKRKCRKTWI